MSRLFIADVRNLKTGETIGTAERKTWNTAIRASESILREWARFNDVILTADMPEVYGPIAEPGSVYRRYWSGGTFRFVVEMAEVVS